MAGKIPLVLSPDRIFNQYQHFVQGALQPIFDCPINYGTQIKNISLQTGANPINFGLNRELNGWFIVRLRGPATLYDSYDTQTESKIQTIVINSSAATSCDLWFY